jgi:ADP-ribose pyrophosphatase
MKTVENFLIQENITIPFAKMWLYPQRQRLSSLCYLELKPEGQLLFLQRKKEPFSGLWTAPGGKLEAGEDPRQTIIREMREETGLTIHRPRLRMITSETGPDNNYDWLLFIFHCTEYTGTLQKCNEGVLKWVSKEGIDDLQIPDVDRNLLPLILNNNRRYYIRLEYDQQLQTRLLQKILL